MPEFDICFEFQNDGDGNTIELTYRLFERDFSSRWLQLFKRALDKNLVPQEGGIFYGVALNKEEDCVVEMKQTIHQINQYIQENNLSGHHIELEPHVGMSQEFLNDVHKRFELLRPDPAFNNMEIQEALANLNTLVHRCEAFLTKGLKGCHIEVNFKEEKPFDIEYGNFEEDDYQLFTPDKTFGYLYLTYGVTGVPVEAAFYAKPKDPPLPQPNYSSGCLLYFNASYEFPFWKEMEVWLRESWGWDINDPKMAIGYIPLGELITPYESQEALIEQIANHQKIYNIKLVPKKNDKGAVNQTSGADSFIRSILQKLGWQKGVEKKIRASEEIVKSLETQNLPAAIWPSHNEIKHHLNFKPYIALNIQFDTSVMLKEAFAVLDKFVSHRNYAVTSEGGSEWKSVGLQAINGDYTKTSYHTNYGIDADPNYQLTEIADKCPETIRFLCSLTDLSQCERVRFMVLEPGAKIHVHKDADADVCTAVNISLNMPAACHFVADANKDGSLNPYTVEIPFKNTGSVVLFNNAKYHYVVNDSEEPRMHIIFHGPIRYSQKSIIEDARKQNGFSNAREVLQALIRKKYELGEAIDRQGELYKDWKTLGISADIIPAGIKIIVVDEEVQGNKKLQEECLYKITGASIFPAPYEIIPFSNLDRWIKEECPDSTEYLILIGSGTLITDVNQFVIEIFSSVAQMKRNNLMICGHIINHNNAIPYLHEQFLILNYQLWKKMDQVALGERYGDEYFDFPGYKASDETIHDDYTPLFLMPDREKPQKKAKMGWGTALIAHSLKKNIEVINVSPELRETKKYAYPNAQEKWQYEEITQDIGKRLEYINKQVFFFNNEELSIRKFQNFQPTQFITVAAGFKPVGILHQYWKGSKPGSIIVMDYSAKAIEYLKGLIHAETPTDLFDHIHDFMRAHPYGSLLDDEGIRNHLRSVIVEAFNNDIDLLVSEWKKFKDADFVHADFVQDHNIVANLFSREMKTVFWHSNAWSCNGILYKMTPAEISENYLALIKKIKLRLQLPAWKHKHSFETIFGKNPQEAHSFITEGAKGEIAQNDWIEIQG